MSLCASCKRVGVDPLADLTDVLERISTHPMSRIDELLPDHWQALRQSAVTSGDLPAGSWQVSEIPEAPIADVVTESASA
ncbi:MAG: transposase domain-containing protein [Planctomycetaceae bacterium]|nr:transposase domain-containing protein [Planctomycetaceae bacterium]